MLLRTILICRRRVVLSALAMLMQIGLAHAEEVFVSGEFNYGPGTSEDEACSAAVARAKESAIRQIYRESFSVLQQDACRESGRGTDSKECFYNSFAWSAIDGEIRSALPLREREISKIPGASKCTVFLKVDVAKPDQSVDVNFHFDVKIDPQIVRPGDSLAFWIEPAGPMYLAIFGWTPDLATGKGQVVRLFPNEFDKTSLLSSKTRLPSQQNSAQYDFKVEWAKGTQRDFIDEYLIFVATKSPISWLTEYAFDSFGQRLREIPQSGKRVLKRSYRIVNQRQM